MTDEAKPDWHEGLTDKERRFVEEYLIDLNGKQAAIRAGYSVKSAKVLASTVMAKHIVRKAIERLFDDRGISRIRILEEVALIAFANVDDYVKIVSDKSGRKTVKITASNDLDREQLAALAEISETVNEAGVRVIKVKPYDKQAALAFLGKVARLTVDRTEVSGPNGGPVQVEDAKAHLENLIEGIAKKAAGETPPEGPAG